MGVDPYKARKRYTVTETLFLCMRRKFGFNKKNHTKVRLREILVTVVTCI
jgi:hypothetical protein